MLYDLFYVSRLLEMSFFLPLSVCVVAGGSSGVVQLYDNIVCGALLAVWCPVTTG